MSWSTAGLYPMQIWAQKSSPLLNATRFPLGWIPHSRVSPSPLLSGESCHPHSQHARSGPRAQLEWLRKPQSTGLSPEPRGRSPVRRGAVVKMYREIPADLFTESIYVELAVFYCVSGFLLHLFVTTVLGKSAILLNLYNTLHTIVIIFYFIK